MTEKTHYRKAFNSPYLSSSDILEPTVLTISAVYLEKDKTDKSNESFNTAYFAEDEIRPGEKLKPMILNAGNSLIVKQFADSSYIDDWTDIAITVYVDANVKFGTDIVDGLRIAPNKPVPTKSLKPNTKQWTNAVKAYKRDGNFDSIEKRVKVSAANKKKIIAQAQK